MNSSLLKTPLVCHTTSSLVPAQARPDGQGVHFPLVPGFLETLWETRLRKPALASARGPISCQSTGSPASSAMHWPLSPQKSWLHQHSLDILNPTSCLLQRTGRYSYQSLVQRWTVTKKHWHFKAALSQDSATPQWKPHPIPLNLWLFQPGLYPTKVKSICQNEKKTRTLIISCPHVLGTWSKTSRSKTSNSKFRDSENTLVVSEH